MTNPSKAPPSTSRPSRRSTASPSATGPASSPRPAGPRTRPSSIGSTGYGVPYGHATALVGHALAQKDGTEREPGKGQA